MKPKTLANPLKMFSKRFESRKNEYVNPDVVLQYLAGENEEGFEVEAIKNIMNQVHTLYEPHQANNESPRVGYLLKDAYPQLKTHPK